MNTRPLPLSILLLSSCLCFASERVSVGQLETIVSAAQQSSDKKAAERLDGLELTERLSNVRFERLNAELPGDESRRKLLVIADASAFLDLPAADILTKPEPERAIQIAILSRAANYVAATTAKMPDFLAHRTTSRYRDFSTGLSEAIPMVVTPQSFRLFDRGSDLVRFEDGKEEDDKTSAKSRRNEVAQSTGVTNLGLFGPLLGVVMSDILKSKIAWGHWEQGPEGPVAVFRYTVPGDMSRYTVHFCCLPAGYGPGRQIDATPPYHGEIAVDPETGSVVRLAVETDPGSSGPVSSADVLIEYGPVVMGGKRYICPLKSVSVAKAMIEIVHAGNHFNGLTPYGQVTDKFNVTWISDIVFDDYHVFATEMHIVPEGR